MFGNISMSLGNVGDVERSGSAFTGRSKNKSSTTNGRVMPNL